MTVPIDIFSAAAMSDDAMVRKKGIGFIDGSISGFALLLGDDAAQISEIATSLTKKQLVVFIIEDAAQDALRNAGVSAGWDVGVVPMSMNNALGFITRVSQVFSNGDDQGAVLDYARERLRGFTLIVGEPTPDRLMQAQAARTLGCPLLSTADLPPSLEPRDNSVEYPAAIGGVDPSTIVQQGIEERGLQIQVPLPELPLAYSPDFSGQVVRDDACGACLAGVELTVTGEDILDG
ncbi:MAG: hypothetical protein KAV87_07675, partial [Desulfobacteraceae bacterium]|nr:hypothetical protein [Desulfobacteraceae bacterium]